MTNDKCKIFLFLIPAFVILEPIWMLTPFVGFLYGSVLNIHFLESSKATSWLLLFVFPTRGLLVPGLVVAVAGATVFLICAFQVYKSKVFQTGMVTTGIYKHLRHPQYTALIVVGAGFVMMWGRFIAYLSFFLMTYLYYLLAKEEERICISKFGSSYEKYRKKTMGLLPGMDLFVKMTARSPFSSWSKGVSVLAGLLLTLGLALGSGFSILKAREAFSAGTRLVVKEATWHGKNLSLVSPRIPYLDQSKGRMHFKFWMKNVTPEDFFLGLESSKRIKDQLRPFYDEGMNTALLIFDPRLSVREEEGKTFFNFHMVPMHAKLELAESDLKGFVESSQVLGLLSIERMLAGHGTDRVKGDIKVVTAKEARENETVKARIQNKVDVLLSRFY